MQGCYTLCRDANDNAKDCAETLNDNAKDCAETLNDNAKDCAETLEDYIEAATQIGGSL